MLFHLLNLVLLSYDLIGAACAGKLNSSSSSSAFVDGDSCSDQLQLGLLLPHVGAVIELEDQESIMAQWQQVEHSEGQLQYAEESLLQGMETRLHGSKIILGKLACALHQCMQHAQFPTGQEACTLQLHASL